MIRLNFFMLSPILSLFLYRKRFHVRQLLTICSPNYKSIYNLHAGSLPEHAVNFCQTFRLSISSSRMIAAMRALPMIVKKKVPGPPDEGRS